MCKNFQVMVLLACLLFTSSVFSLTGCSAENGTPSPEEEEQRQKITLDQEETARPEEEKETEEEIRISYLGHSAFLVEVGETRVLMDPYSPEIGYETLSFEVDIVTISHEHVDHNYTGAARGNPQILRGLTQDAQQWQEVDYSTADIHITTVGTYHDDVKGSKRGLNAAFLVEAGGLRLVHLGDLGHLLEEDQVNKLKPVDVLMIPVGGHYTLGPGEADQVIEQLNPKVVIPMHYRTEATASWPIQELGAFLANKDNIKNTGEKSVTLTQKALPESREIWPLSP